MPLEMVVKDVPKGVEGGCGDDAQRIKHGREQERYEEKAWIESARRLFDPAHGCSA